MVERIHTTIPGHWVSWERNRPRKRLPTAPLGFSEPLRHAMFGKVMLRTAMALIAACLLSPLEHDVTNAEFALSALLLTTPLVVEALADLLTPLQGP